MGVYEVGTRVGSMSVSATSHGHCHGHAINRSVICSLEADFESRIWIPDA